MIAKAFAMYMGGSNRKRTVRHAAPYGPSARPVRKTQ